MDLTPDTVDDEGLVEQYRAGREEAFDQLLQRYRQEMFHFLLRFTGSRVAAEDVFQETFLQVHLSIESFRTEKRFKPWLFTIAANKARDHLRRSKRRTMARLSAPVHPGAGDQDRSFLDLVAADQLGPEQEAVRRETQERVRQVVDRLPDHLREILMLAYFHQFAYKDIADILQIPLGTVKSRLHSAVGTFAGLWKQGAEQADQAEPRSIPDVAGQ